MEKPSPEKSRTNRQSTNENLCPNKCTVQQGPSPKKAKMEPSSESPKKAKTDHRRVEEGHLYSLYSKVIDRIQGSKRIQDDEVTFGVDDIVSSFQYDQGGRFFDVDYSEYENVCAYLFRYGAHGAGLARCRVLEAASNCAALREVLCQEEARSDLRVVSLGGGPGNDALGFCSALVELGFPLGRGVDIAVVDLITQWEECLDHALNLAEGGDFGNVSEMFRKHPVKMEFHRAKLPTLPAACHEAVTRADVILMTKVLSSFEGDENDMVEKLRSTMKDSALLVLIDSPFWPDLWDDFEVLYPPDEDQQYRTIETHTRFERRDNVVSKACVAVLRLRKHPDVDPNSDSDIIDKIGA